MNKFCKDSSAGEEGAKPTEDDSGKDEEAAATKIQAGFKGITDLRIVIFNIYSKLINIWWIRTCSHPYEENVSTIVLYPVFYEYKKTVFSLIIVHFLSTESCL